MWKLMAVLLGGLVFFGCASDNAFTAAEDKVIFKPAEKSKPSNEPKIFLTTDPIRERDGYKILGEIRVVRIWYGGYENVYQEMANKGLELEADAIVEIETWMQPTAGAWAAPQGIGKAIKINKGAKIDFKSMDGKWWSFAPVEREKPLEDPDQSEGGGA